MNKKFLITLGVAVVLANSAVAAEDQKKVSQPAAPAKAQTSAAVPTPVNAPSLEQRQKQFKEQFDKWTAMSKEEKLKTVTTQHDTMVKSMEANWTKMTDDQKIAQRDAMYANQKKQLDLK